MFSPNKAIVLGDKIINLERGNQGSIVKVNDDGSYLVKFPQ